MRCALADRLAACKLVLHPEKTKIVYCKDVNRRGDHPNQTFAFLGFAFRARKTVWHGNLYVHGFRPAVSPKALKAISRTIRGWALHHRSDKSLQDLAAIYNPYIRGWINYYGQFYRKQLRPTLLRIDTYLVRWARWKFKRLRRRHWGAREWLARVRAPIQRSSHIGASCMSAAEHRKPCELRGSRTVLGARGGEIPPRDLPIPVVSRRMDLLDHLVGARSMVGGMVSPSALAVFRLTITVNTVGNWTGSSAGVAPLRILST